jgi:6-phosphogluconolactonase
MFVYVGSYTRQQAAAGIGVYRLDQQTGALVERERVEASGDAFFLTEHPHRSLLFAADGAEGSQGEGSGAVSAFAIDPATGHLTLLNRQPSHGTVPCYVSVEPGGRYALVANYGSGSVAVFPIEADGRLAAATDVAERTGRGPHPQRQEGPHPHYAAPDPTGERILVCDLGTDQVLGYHLDAATGRLRPDAAPLLSAGAGAGPRHLTFDPTGRFAYVIDELDSTLVACRYDAAAGALHPLHTVSTLPGGFEGENYPAHVLVAPSGRFVYGSNRGHDSIAIFAVEAATGRLTPLGHEPARGRWPWHFAVDPTGAFLLVANQRSDGVATFRVDREGGTLQATEQTVEVPAPTCILFSRT